MVRQSFMLLRWVVHLQLEYYPYSNWPITSNWVNLHRSISVWIHNLNMTFGFVSCIFAKECSLIIILLPCKICFNFFWIFLFCTKFTSKISKLLTIKVLSKKFFLVFLYYCNFCNCLIQHICCNCLHPFGMLNCWNYRSPLYHWFDSFLYLYSWTTFHLLDTK